jgi:hypothetical protein
MPDQGQNRQNMNTYSCSPRFLTLLAQAKLLLRVAARDSKDARLKSDADGIATQLDHLINRSSQADRGEQLS